MGIFDSSLTRVAPVFDALLSTDPSGNNWLQSLLALAQCGTSPMKALADLDFSIEECCYGKNEKPLAPPLALLSWLVRNFTLPEGVKLNGSEETVAKRKNLLRRNPKTIDEALSLLRWSPVDRGWHILEGSTQPDVFISTPDAIIVIEGKRTEYGPTTFTTWMPGRHQMLRHIDCAWEIRGRRSVYGFFIVEGNGGEDAVEVPQHWVEAAKSTILPEAVQAGLPHRGPEEREGILNSFLGVATWQKICKEFRIPWSGLPDTLSEYM